MILYYSIGASASWPAASAPSVTAARHIYSITYIYIYIDNTCIMCICVYICICVYVCMYVYIYIYMCIYMYACMYACMYVCVYIYIYIQLIIMLTM